MITSTPHAEGFIVVGIDGSEASEVALGWAARQAELTDAALLLVMAQRVPALAYGAGVIPSTNPDFDSAGREVLEGALNRVLGPDSSTVVSTVVAHDAPAQALIFASEGADLLVVGSRGHGAVTGMLLGSVSEHCVAHASCPVVVVRRQPHKKS